MPGAFLIEKRKGNLRDGYHPVLFDQSKRNSMLSDIIGRYNKIVLEVETDPGLRIEFEAK